VPFFPFLWLSARPSVEEPASYASGPGHCEFFGFGGDDGGVSLPEREFVLASAEAMRRRGLLWWRCDEFSNQPTMRVSNQSPYT